MNKYAVIELNKKQYLIEEGQEVVVDYQGGVKPEAKVLLAVDGDKVSVGTPDLKKMKVDLKVVEEKIQGEKLHVKKFKSKSRYRKKIGFRPVYTKLAVQKIT